ncbi:NAD(P)-binding protein [Corynespora cassiicola Philippines]|uniref:NAD(P)-binding protein n=1 Tax=Corynespora cassiicola Philippines TaxID=1448308 RepID=A0A2T2P3H6_CORCC|nr:NAD(P)-binding protein [Corynespora cassiicola Philippines]
MPAPLKNIIIAGATGSVGAPILSALLEAQTFNITVLSRASSPATFPPNIHAIKISDEYPLAELTEAFAGQDAAIIALSTQTVAHKDGSQKDDLPFRLIDAAVAAGVKRFIPSEFGTNNLDPKARSLSPVYNAKGEMLEYLMKKSEESDGKLTWTSFSCGSWLDWALDPAKSGNFLFIDVKNRKATVYDKGTSPFTVTTSKNTGLAVARALAEPELSANRQVFLRDFSTNSLSIIAALEAEMGHKFAVEERESAPEMKERREKYDTGDWNAMFPLLAISFVGDVDVGVNFKEEELWNEKLGLPKVTLEQVIKEAVELAERS